MLDLPAPKIYDDDMDYTFENFRVETGNKHAFAAAQAVSQRRRDFEILYVYGPSGSGKTHLLHAIGKEALEKYGYSGLYFGAGAFAREFLGDNPEEALSRFQQKCDVPDILLLDDLQYFVGRESAFRGLLTILEHLSNKGSHVVLASDCKAQEINDLSLRLHSVYRSAYYVDLPPPAFT